MYSVPDGSRILKFRGVELATSTSRTRNKPRWVEFTLYRTEKGHYVLSRIGISLVYHHGSCPTVRRNNLDPLPSETLSESMIPCEDCGPDLETDELVFPETDRKWAQVSDTAQGVIASLKQYDSSGTEYLTSVSRVLLEEAAKIDEQINDAFYTEWIS